MRRKALLAIAAVVTGVLVAPPLVQAQVPPTERSALVALYQSTGGPGWTNSTGWLGPQGNECSWFGVTCDQGHVVGLDLPNNNLAGEVPSGLTGLSSLVHLDLSGNQLSGPVPVFLAQLSVLEVLNLSYNQLSGPVPPQLTALTRLNGLLLSGNQLTGPIPPELATMASLYDVELRENQLTGHIPPELGQLPNLVTLSVGGNQLTGNIPPELGNLSNLGYLDLGGNQLEGSIPDQLAGLQQLIGLWLGGNQLEGSIPPGLGVLAQLNYLSLEANQLDGTIPPELGNLSSLQNLNLSANLLTGSIPPQLGNLGQLQGLWLAVNQLDGTIPPQLGNLGSLTSLGLSVNDLHGPIPSELGNLGQLQYLWIDTNHLDGTIPPELGNLTSLLELGLGANRLGGAIPSELGQLTSLTRLFMAANRLVGEVPASLANLTQLADGGLDLRLNALYTTNQQLLEFLNSRQDGHDWANLQTVAPNDVSVTAVTTDSVQLSWTLIPYSWDPGAYRILAATSSGGPYALAAATQDKQTATAVVSGLVPDTTYYFVVQTETEPIDVNQNTVESEPSAEVSATTQSATACAVSCGATVATQAAVGDAVAFQASATATNCTGEVGYAWSFGDGESSTEQSPTHAYGATGTYTWRLETTADGAVCRRSGSVVVHSSGTDCGNGTCEVGETAWTCPADCGLGADQTGRVPGSATHIALPAAVGGQGGVGGTYWVTEAMLHNPGSEPATVTVRFVADNQPDDPITSEPITLTAGGAEYWANFVQELFGVSSNGSVRVESDQPVMLVSRTFNDQPQGTYGQFLGGVNTSRAFSIGDLAYLIGLAEGASFRTNVILQEVEGAETQVLLTLYADSGEQVGTATATVPALAKYQKGFPGLGLPDVEDGYLTVEVSDGGQVVALASVVDQSTGDATTVDALHRSQAELATAAPRHRRVKTLQTVDFTWSPEAPLVNESVQFTDLSSSDVRSWSWRFGDGGSSTEQNPTHTYTAAGSYSVTLVVASSSFGSAFATQSLTVSEAPATGVHYLLAVVARQPGAEGTTWRSDVWVMNPLEDAQQVWLEYHPVGGGDLQRTEVLVPAAEQVVLEDVVGSTFPAAGDGKGALHVFAPEGVFVTSRTYNLGTSGTYGQALPALAAGDLLAPSDNGRLLKLMSTSTMRCNVGFTEMDGVETSVTLQLLSVEGGEPTPLAEQTYQVEPYENYQVNRVFQALGLTGEYDQALALVTVGSGGHIYAYASNVDSRTGDGEFIPAMKE